MLFSYRLPFNAFWNDATRRRFDMVMAWSVDRLGRSLQDLVAFLSELHALGIDLYLHQQGVDTSSPAGKALFQMMGVFAEFERAMIRERVKSGLGDITRFANPRQLMAYLGLVPSEHSSGATRRQGGITKAGNGAARRMLIEAAWSYRFPARISREQLLRQEGLAKPIRDTAWKAQERLCRRYRKLARAGKSPTVVTTAIARELAGFAWAIARHVQIAGA